MLMAEFWLISENNQNNLQFIHLPAACRFTIYYFKMKKSVISLLASLLLVSGVFAKHTILITNSLGFDRKGETIEISIKSLKESSFGSKSYVLKNNENKETGYQLIYNGNHNPVSLIFQADVKAKESSTYTLSEGKPIPVKAKTFGRFVPERKDDFAWENDMAAYRMYGPALANENPSNGVDLWVKRTDELIVDEFYDGEHNKGLSYHVDNGHGLDLYKVGHALGVGGIAPYVNNKLWVGNQFSSYRVHYVGSLRTSFSLIYDSVKVGNVFYKEVLTITTNAGSIFNKGVVTLTGPPGNIELAAGIFLHDGKGTLKQNAANGTSAYAEAAVSDAGVPSGRDYVGFYIPAKVNAAQKESEHGLMTSSYKVGDKFTYFFGGGWSKWHFPTDEDWFKAVNQFSETSKNPLKVTVK